STGSGQAKARQSMQSGSHGLPRFARNDSPTLRNDSPTLRNDSLFMKSPPNPARYRTRTLNKNFVTASVARQSMQSRDMDCFTAFAMTGLFMESEAWQSTTGWIAALRSQ
ncbi:MAG: hypothetical protein WAV14_06350, partial [Rhodoferax sp.]